MPPTPLALPFLQTWRRVIAVMQPLLHDREIIFEQIEQLGFDPFALLQPGQNKSRHFDALPVTTRAAGDEGNIQHDVRAFALPLPIPWGEGEGRGDFFLL